MPTNLRCNPKLSSTKGQGVDGLLCSVLVLFKALVNQVDPYEYQAHLPSLDFVPAFNKMLYDIQHHGSNQSHMYVVPGHAASFQQRQLVTCVVIYFYKVKHTRIVVILAWEECPREICWMAVGQRAVERVLLGQHSSAAPTHWLCVSHRPKQASRPPIQARLLSTTTTFSWWLQNSTLESEPM